ncbi:uncharacterized protein LOC126744679 [Anthonomus grandis grandis]|uniref:uncharacterized protein LOC126744679 n=1 Tax=Anthonomus grandis grandis TaxID=2921223 RepID=UPI002165723C|nr:uncharacterized protein LOC126744679 [Anthonomus grandis grandis]
MGEDQKKKSEKCLRKSNLLVYQQPSGQRTDRRFDDCKNKIKIPICTPKPKTIRVCTGAELRKMCPPPVCPCEPTKKKVRSFGLIRFLGFGLKSAIAAAMVYITYDMGIWGTTEDTQQLYSNACTMFGSPRPKKNTKWDPPSCEAESEFFPPHTYNPYAQCEEPPIRTEDTYMKFKNLWNQGVSSVFHGIANFPGNLMSFEGKSKAKDGDGKKEDVKCVSYSQLSDEEREKLTNIYK